jgi:chemotaxis protein methyltransferase CheR
MDEGMLQITDAEFARFKGFIFDAAGITLADSKKALVSGRLMKRVRQLHCRNYSEYFEFLSRQRDPAEAQLVVDLLTTNETFFFREKVHFDFLQVRAEAARRERRALRVWSAACASGEEAYSIAMTLAEAQADLPWQVLASDISARMLQRARRGHYPDSRAEQTPPHLRQHYCLRGTGPQAGTLLMERALRDRVEFRQINLNRPLPPGLGEFDLIFLRNVMIYFNLETKRQVVARLLMQLRRGGFLLVGHSESLNEVSNEVAAIAPTIYRKP